MTLSKTAQLHRDAVLALLEEVLALRRAIVTEGQQLLAGFGGAGAPDAAVGNLAHYLALRHHDVRLLQRQLMWRGLSSIGRLEGRVLPAIDAVIGALAALSGEASHLSSPTEAEFFAGDERLGMASDLLFGPRPQGRRTRIMVTLPGEAAADPALVLDLARRGMDIARINCAHDDAEDWQAMAGHVRAAEATLGRRLTVLMDIAGPKIRTAAVITPEKTRLQPGDRLRLVAEGQPRVDELVRFGAAVSLPEMVNRLTVGDRVRYDDGKLEGVVETISGDEAVVRVTLTKTGGAKLKPEKGLNLPDTALGLSPLTSKDETDLATVVGHADMIGYSFVSRADDIDILEAALARHGLEDKPLGLVAKIEIPEAVRNLPAMIAGAAGRRPFGVMIARGDLAAEIGFERLAEMQEEILWICEAASVPAIWATQVLEDLVTSGVPSRGEMTDAAMASRAECVLLNKGPEVSTAIELLDRLLARMDDHQYKKTPMLRALKSW